MNRRPALPQKVCMWFDDETLDACGEKANEVGRMEIPLGSLTAVQLQEVIRTRAESMPGIGQTGYRRARVARENLRVYHRRTETAAAHPSEGGCFIVIELYLCLEHRARIYNAD